MLAPAAVADVTAIDVAANAAMSYIATCFIVRCHVLSSSWHVLHIEGLVKVFVEAPRFYKRLSFF